MGLLASRVPSPNPRVLLDASITWGNVTLPLGALIDSGADENFLDCQIARRLKIPQVPLDTPLHATGLNGQPLAIVTHRTPRLSLLTSSNHHESLALHLISSPAAPLVLGLPWLSSHNPYIDWSRGKIRNWSTSCHSSCLLSARAPGDPVPPVSPPLPPDLSGVPDVYHDLAPVFSKNLALSLPPHRPYDCSIDLLPDAPLPSSHLYNLSRPERESMEQYIKDSLAAGIIRP